MEAVDASTSPIVGNLCHLLCLLDIVEHRHSSNNQPITPPAQHNSMILWVITCWEKAYYLVERQSFSCFVVKSDLLHLLAIC